MHILLFILYAILNTALNDKMCNFLGFSILTLLQYCVNFNCHSIVIVFIAKRNDSEDGYFMDLGSQPQTMLSERSDVMTKRKQSKVSI